MICFLFLTLVAGWFTPLIECDIESGWKGIVVFQSTREQVDKILGSAVDDDGTVNYVSEDALVHVIYSEAPCSSGQRDRGKFNVPKGTVLWYTVVLKKEIDLREFDYQEDLYKRVVDPHMKDQTQYFNMRDGIWFKTVNRKSGEMVWSITYNRSESMIERFGCKSFQDDIR